jgi:DNA mismatch repair protein MutS2
MKKRLNRRILDILEWPVIEEKIVSLCVSDSAKKMVTKLKPVPEQKIKVQLKKISAMKELISTGRPPVLSGISDVSGLCSLAEKGGVLALEELQRVKEFTIASERIKRYLASHREEFSSLEDEYSRINPLDRLGSILGEAITEDVRLNEDKFTILRKIKREIQSSRQDMEKRLGKIIHSPDNEKIIQEKAFTTVNGRYVILVRSGMKSRIRGNVHDISSSGATVYFEPAELTDLNNTIITLEKELGLEIQKILAELTIAVAAHSELLTSNLRVLTFFDFINAAAKLSIITRSSEPVISAKPILRLYSAHHPVLFMMSPGTTVSNDVELGTDYNCLIISGANTGGKTVMLKTIGLCALFAMYGLHVPAAPDSEIGIFHDIMADIGDDQNLSRSLSTFSGQLEIINEILNRADDRSLVIIDEIIVGTNPRQGAALAQSILEYMIETDSRIVVTTHYTELKELAVNDPRFRNGSVTFDLDTLKPTYELRIGVPGISHAVEIARIYGVPENILGRADELIDSRESGVDSLLEKVQSYETEIKEEREKVRLLTAEIETERKKIKSKQAELDALISETKQGRGIDFLAEIDSMRGKIAERITHLQDLDQKDAGRLNEELLKLRAEISARLSDESREKYSDTLEPLDPGKVKKGDRVFIASIEAEGTLEEVDSSGRNASVLLGGSIKSRFRTADLFLIPGPSGKSTGQKKHRRPAISGIAESVISTTIQTSYNTIDLRGMRVDEALSFMNSSLDRMERQGIKTVIIIHGHGTGAMKQAVRDELKMNIYVRDFRPGEYGEGGDGVSVAVLR